MSTAVPHIKALDGLRGLAVALILLFHAGHFKGGWLGVDLFFVLSGFLITSLLLAEWETSEDVSLVAFWERRVRRLLPALFVLLLGVCLYAVLFAQPSELERIRADGIATLFYFANWHAIFAGHDYWAIFSTPSPLDHTWSLSIEEQFYLLWPPLVLLVLRRSNGSRFTLATVAAGLGLLSVAWMAWLFDSTSGTARVYFGTDTRAFATLMGALVATGFRSHIRSWPNSSTRFGDFAGALALGTLLVASTLLDGSNPWVYRGGLFALVVAACVVVMSLLVAPHGYVSRCLSVAPLRGLGLISYGVYLWHWPVNLVINQERMGLSGAGLTIVRVLVTLVVAMISFYTVERPVRRGLNSSRGLWLGAGASTVVVLAAGWIATATPGGSDETTKAPVASASDLSRDLDVLLVGDSIPFQLRPEFLSEVKRRQLQAGVMAAAGCSSLRSQSLRYLSGQRVDLDLCLEVRDQWIAAAAQAQPTVVIVLEGWTGEGSKKVDGQWTEPCTSEFDAAYARDLTDLVSRLLASGAEVAVVATPPPMVQDLPSRFSKLWGGVGRSELKPLFSKRVACQNRVRRNVARSSKVILLDLDAHLCPNGECNRYLGDQLLRLDGMHFEGPGAAWASAWLLDQLHGRL
jgi:peptidoglycan/LPS O-acetylase OafA/YrhL